MTMKKQAISLFLCMSILLVASVIANTQNIDLGGQVIGIAIYNNFNGVTPLGDRNEYNWEQPDARLAAHIAQVEQMFDCKIQFVDKVGSGKALERITVDILAGQPSFHFIHAREMDLPALAAGGYIHCVEDYLPEGYYESLPSVFQTTEGSIVNERIYGIEPQNYTIEAIMLFWNKDMFEREGLPNLYELYQSGEWTWDKFEEFAVRLSKDTDGDGEIDQWGFSLHNDNFVNFILTNNGRLTKVENGKVVVAFDEPATVEAIEFMQRLYQKGAFGYKRGGGLSNGKVAMSMDIVQSFHNKKESMGGYEYGIVPLPKGPRATDYVSPIWNRWLGVIPITVEDPAAVIEVINALYKLTEPYMDITLDEWEEQYWYGTVAKQVYDEESLENWMWSSANAKVLEHRGLVNQASFKDVVVDLVYEGGSVAAKLAEIKPAAQAVLDEVFKQ